MYAISKRLKVIIPVFAFLFLLSGLHIAYAYTLSGTIFGGSSPLLGATVTLINASTSVQVGTSTTGAGGTYSFTVGNGTYNLTVGSGLGNSVVNGIVINGADVSENVVLVQQAVVLDGVVRNSGGTGIENVYVEIDDNSSGVSAGSVCTDANGHYSIPLVSGTYRVLVSGGSYDYSYGNCGTTTNVPMPKRFYGKGIVQNLIISGNATQNITIPIVTMSGQTTDSSGVAVGNVTINQNTRDVAQSLGFYQVENDYSNSPIKSDASGNYSMVLISGTGYSVTLIPPAGTGVAQTGVSGIDTPSDTTRNLALKPAVTLSGKITNSGGTGIKNVYVEIDDNSSGVPAGSVCTDANGNYSIPLISGTYRILVSGGSYDYSYGSCGTTTNVPTPKRFYGKGVVQNLTVSGNAIQNISIPIVTMSGKTTDSSGVEVGNVTINQKTRDVAQSLGFYQVENDYSNSPIKSDASGTYSMVLISGTGYSVTLIPPAGTGVAQTAASGIDAPSDITRNLALQSAVTLSGKITNSGGTGIENVYVEIDDNSSGLSAGSTCTDANGNYSIPLVSGTYRLLVSGGSYDYSYGSCGTTTNVPTPKRFYGKGVVQNLTISGNATQNITIPFVTMSGQTTDSNGVAVGNVTINQTTRDIAQSLGFYQVENDYNNSPIKSDAAGNYSLVLIPGSGYSETIIPPQGSGFAQTIVNNLSVTQNVSQNIILSFVDATPPIIISGPSATSTTDTSAIAGWQTNKPAQCSIKYGTTNPPTTSISEPTGFAVNHSVTVSGLTPDTLYYVNAVSCTGQNGYSSLPGPVATFRTNPAPPPIPTIFSISISSIGYNSAVIRWQTDVPATGRVTYGLTSTPSTPVDDPNTATTSHSVTLSGLTHDTTYFFKVSSANGTGAAESVVQPPFTTASLQDTTPPIILGPGVIDISDTATTVIWETDEPATSGVSYYYLDGSGTQVHGVLNDTTLVNKHWVHVTGLLPSTAYYFTPTSVDGYGNGPTTTPLSSITTLATPDPFAAAIVKGPDVAYVTNSAALITWQTNKSADSTVNFGTSADALGQKVGGVTMTTDHALTLTGLAANTTYYYQVASKDVYGNGTVVSGTKSFTTSATADTTAPVITDGPTVTWVTDTAAILSWVTNEASDSRVTYGLQGGSLQSSSLNVSYVTAHSVVLTNLQSGTAYSFQAASTDPSGNLSSYSAIQDFTTKVPGPPDLTPPVCTVQPIASNITNTSAVITWQTDEPSTSSVRYGNLPVSLNWQTLVSGLSTSHSVTLVNLTPATPYYFKTMQLDIAVNGSECLPILPSFTTKATPAIITLPTASGLIYGQALSQSTLSGGTASVPGTFSFTNPATVPAAGDYHADITFTPSDIATYSTVTSTITVAVATGNTWFIRGDLNHDGTVNLFDYNIVFTNYGLTNWGNVADINGDCVVDDADLAIFQANFGRSDAASPRVTTMPTAGSLTYGQSLSQSTLSGGAASVPGTFVFTNPATFPPVGNYLASIIFTPSDTISYNTITSTITVVVTTGNKWFIRGDLNHDGTVDQLDVDILSANYDQTNCGNIADINGDCVVNLQDVSILAGNTGRSDATSTIVTKMPTASGLTYGQSLSQSTLTGGAASVPGTFSYTHPDTIPPAGNYVASIIFTPSDTISYNTITSTIAVAVTTGNKWFIRGDFSHDGTVDQLDMDILAANYSQTNCGNIADINGDCVVNIRDVSILAGNMGKSDATSPIVTKMPTASGLTYGQSLSHSPLSGGTASVPGTFAYTNPATIPPAGNYVAGITFTPSAPLSYNTITSTITVVVTKPWFIPGDINRDGTVDSLDYGILHANYDVLNADNCGNIADITGDCVVNGADLSFLHSNYGKSDATSPSVTTKPTASGLTYGQVLSESALTGGTASVLGTFAYITPGTIIPAVGNYTAVIRFTPNDASYNTIASTITVPVARPYPIITTLPLAGGIVYGQALSASSLSGGVASVPGSFAFTTPATIPSSVGNYGASVTFTPTDAANYSSVIVSVNVVVANLQYTVTPFAGVGGSISPNVPQTAVNNGPVSFTITPSGANTIASVSGCSGTLNGAIYTTGPAGGDCDVVVTFSASGKKLPVVQVPQTGQAGCWDAQGNSVACAGSGQDAAKSFGAALPSSRFGDNGNGTKTDTLTGLVWLQNGGCFGALSWANAVSGVASLASGSCGLSDGSAAGDWRLPNRKELMSLINWQQQSMSSWLNIQGFSNIQNGFYWSSSTLLSNSNNAYSVDLGGGGVSTKVKTNLYNVMGVRNGN
jgi:rRNA maturation protein Nop10